MLVAPRRAYSVAHATAITWIIFEHILTNVRTLCVSLMIAKVALVQ